MRKKNTISVSKTETGRGKKKKRQGRQNEKDFQVDLTSKSRVNFVSLDGFVLITFPRSLDEGRVLASGSEPNGTSQSIQLILN